MDWLLILLIPSLAVGALLGFLAGVRYCGQRLLPRLLGTMHPKELNRVIRQAMAVREANGGPDET